MGTESLEVSGVVASPPDRAYRAWLDPSAPFTARGDYVTGTDVDLDRGRRVVRASRAIEFPAGSPPSRVEIFFEAVGGGTRVRIAHTDIPTGRSDHYRKEWTEQYLEPLTQYFSSGGIGNDDNDDDDVTPTDPSAGRAASKNAISASPAGSVRPRFKNIAFVSREIQNRERLRREEKTPVPPKRVALKKSKKAAVTTKAKTASKAPKKPAPRKSAAKDRSAVARKTARKSAPVKKAPVKKSTRRRR